MRTIKRVLIVAGVLALSGCASHTAHRVQEWAPGHTLAELEQCAGKPNVTDTLADGSFLAQWDYIEPTANSTLPIPVSLISDVTTMVFAPVLAPLAGVGTISTQVAASGGCHAIATVRDGRVTQLRYAGPNGGLSGPDAVCAPIMRGCLRP